MDDELKKERAARIAEFSWKKGKSGNPAGSQKGRSLSQAIKEALYQVDPNSKEGHLFVQSIARKLVELAAHNGSIKAAQEILDRTEGKAPEKLEITHIDRQERINMIREKYAALTEAEDHTRVN